MRSLLVVSVPLRGLGSWKVEEVNLLSTYLTVSVPLRGLGSWKAHSQPHSAAAQITVSVPLRGLGSWKVPGRYPGRVRGTLKVSVPLRGLGSWKEQYLSSLGIPSDAYMAFQSPCGD